jgi:hypothetical protein
VYIHFLLSFWHFLVFLSSFASSLLSNVAVGGHNHALNTASNHLSHLDGLTPHDAEDCKASGHNDLCLVGTTLEVPHPQPGPCLCDRYQLCGLQARSHPLGGVTSIHAWHSQLLQHLCVPIISNCTIWHNSTPQSDSAVILLAKPEDLVNNIWSVTDLYSAHVGCILLRPVC